MSRLARMNTDPTGAEGRLRVESEGLERNTYSIYVLLKRIEYDVEDGSA